MSVKAKGKPKTKSAKTKNGVEGEKKTTTKATKKATKKEPTKKEPTEDISLELKNEMVELRLIEKFPASRFQNCRRGGVGSIEDLEKSIEDNGIIQAPILFKEKLDKPRKKPWGEVDVAYWIVAGNRRILAQRNVVRKNADAFPEAFKIDAKVVEGDFDELKEELYALNYQENIQRKNLTIMEIVEQVQFLREEFGYTHQELGDKIGKSLQWVGAALSFHKDATEPLTEAAKAEIIPYSTAQKIAKMEPSHQMRVVQDYINGLKDKKKATPGEKRTLGDSVTDPAKKKGTPNRAMRPADEVKKRLDGYLQADLSSLSEAGQAYYFGIQIALHWTLNNPVSDKAWAGLAHLDKKLQTMEAELTPKPEEKGSKPELAVIGGKGKPKAAPADSAPEASATSAA